MRGDIVDHIGAKREVWVNHSPIDDGTTSLFFIWWFHDEVSGFPGLVGMMLNLTDGTMTIMPNGVDETGISWPAVQ